MVALNSVATAGEVEIAAPIARIEVVEDFVREPLEVDHGAVGPALGGVIEHDVENHADAGGMQRVDHVSELAAVRSRDSLQ